MHFGASLIGAHPWFYCHVPTRRQGLLTFCTNWFVYRYLAMYTYYPVHESGGQLFPIIIHYGPHQIALMRPPPAARLLLLLLPLCGADRPARSRQCVLGLKAAVAR